MSPVAWVQKLEELKTEADIGYTLLQEDTHIFEKESAEDVSELEPLSRAKLNSPELSFHVEFALRVSWFLIKLTFVKLLVYVGAIVSVSISDKTIKLFAFCGFISFAKIPFFS